MCIRWIKNKFIACLTINDRMSLNNEKNESYIGSLIYEERTSIGRGKVKMASMNKHKRRSWKKYRRQGK